MVVILLLILQPYATSIQVGKLRLRRWLNPSHASHTGLRAWVQICSTHMEKSGMGGEHLQPQCLGRGQWGQQTQQMVSSRLATVCVNSREELDPGRLDVDTRFPCTHKCTWPHKHIRTPRTYNHMVEGLWKEPDRNKDLMAKQKPYLSPRFPRGRAFTMYPCNQTGQGQSCGASHYPLRWYRMLFSVMAHS